MYDKFESLTKEDIIKELKRLREELVVTKTYGEKNTCLESIITYNQLLSSLTGDDVSVNINRILKKQKNSILLSGDKEAKLYDNFSNNFISNKEFFKELTSNLLKTLEDSILEFDNKDYDLYLYPEEDIITLIINFFYEYYPNKLDLVEDMLKKKRVIGVDNLTDYSGVCFHIYKNLPIVLFQRDRNLTLKEFATITHELGHVIDFEDLDSRYSSNFSQKYFYNSTFLELNSLLVETQSLDFLSKNKLNELFVREIQYNNLISTYTNLIGINLFTELDNDLIKNGSVLFCDSDFVKGITNLDLVYGDNNFSFNLKDNLMYGLSGVMASYFNSLISEYKELGQKMYNDFWAYRCDLFRPQLFDELNINQDDIGKRLVKQIKKIN